MNNDWDKLFVFEHKGEVVQLKDLGWTKEGNASAWSVSPPFGLDDTRSIEAGDAVKNAEDFLLGDSSFTESQIEVELSKSLAINDPFWASWRLRRTNCR